MTELEQARRGSNTEVAAELLRLSGARALDIGCGDGKFTCFLARSGAATTGIDVNPKVLARGRKRAADAGLAVTLIEARAEDLPFPDASFDVVVFSNSLHHVDPSMMDHAVAEAARVLRPGGDLYIMEPVADGAYFEATRLVNDEREVRNRARAAATAAPNVTLLRELEFRTPRSWSSFEEFAAEQADRSDKRRRALERHGAELRALFEGAARREGGRLVFDQVFRVHLLRKPDGPMPPRRRPDQKFPDATFKDS